MRNWSFAGQSAYAQTLVNSLSVGIAIFEDTDFRLLAANAAYQALLGSPLQYEQRKSAQLCDMVPSFVRTNCLALFKQVAQTRTTVHGEAAAKQASTGTLTSWGWTLTPLAGTAVGYLLLTVHEVTLPGWMPQDDRGSYTDLVPKEPETPSCPSVLRENSGGLLQSRVTPPFARSLWPVGMNEECHQWAALLDQMPEGVLLVEATTSIIRYANAMAMQLLGLPISQLVGRPLNQVAEATSQQPGRFEHFTRWNFALIRALAGETVPNEEALVNRPDGSQAVMLCSVSPIRGTQGRITQAVIVFQDITAQKTLELQKEEFFAAAHHELRTPLTVILGFTELLQMMEHTLDDQRRRNALERILQEGVRLRALLHDLLDVSRLDHVHMDIQRVPHDVLALLQEVVEKYQVTVQTHCFHLIVQDAPHLSECVGWIDHLRIAQVLENLLTNAVKYSPRDSEIEIGLHCGAETDGTIREALIWVKNQGHGITEQDLAHIFERFYRGIKRDPSIGGFGIGLFLAKEIVQKHGGHIWAESTQGQGSTFFVRLPLGERL